MSEFQHRQRRQDSHSGWCWLAQGDGEGTSLEAGQVEAIQGEKASTCKGDGLVDGLERGER